MKDHQHQQDNSMGLDGGTSTPSPAIDTLALALTTHLLDVSKGRSSPYKLQHVLINMSTFSLARHVLGLLVHALASKGLVVLTKILCGSQSWLDQTGLMGPPRPDLVVRGPSKCLQVTAL